MYIDRLLRLIAGTFTLLSLALAHFHNPKWLWLTAFVGLNLLQSGFTNWCPMMSILEKAGVPRIPPTPAPRSTP
ncbi:DUF2892 domain-containing protein [Geomonas sp. RF6]|uniref:YgaP family membrane protein n=1 Tax=Geomonas sp. RF6 TaxID=2897342 RepID=UPI001E2846FC|nr:DUF2892 domain-containing protein [Geomonas sp. RF6]UFS69985.1 DUF2892 domain-containing protein [Geomonas sp. RF6]